MQKSMVMFTFSLFGRKYLFWGKLGSKNQNCQFELKFGSWTNLNMQNSMVIFTFFVLDQKNLPGQILSKNPKLFVQSFIQRLIRIDKIPFYLF